MKEEPEGFLDNERGNNLVRRFEKMRREGTFRFMDVSDYEEIINTYMDKGQLEKAGQTIRLALHQHPGSVAIRLKKADLLISQEKDAQALELLHVLVPLDSQNYEVYLLRGIAYVHLGRPREAIRDFDQALALGDEYVWDIAYQIGNEWERSGLYKEALSYMIIASKDNPEDLSILFEMGFIYQQLGEDEKAIHVYKDFLEEEPFDTAAWGNLGRLYLKLEKYEEALDAFEYLLAIHVNNQEGLFYKGRALMHLGRFREAKEEYRIYVSLSPHDVEGMINLGTCYSENEEYGRALSWYQMAIVENPDNPLPYFLSAEIYLSQGKWEKAESYCRKAIALDHKDDEFWYALFRILEQTGTTKQQVEIMDMLTALAPDKVVYWIEYLILLLDLQHEREFETVMKRALRYLPEAAELFYLKGIVLFQKGRNGEGEEYILKAWSVNPAKWQWFLVKYPALLDVPEIHELMQHLKPE